MLGFSGGVLGLGCTSSYTSTMVKTLKIKTLKFFRFVSNNYKSEFLSPNLKFPGLKYSF